MAVIPKKNKERISYGPGDMYYCKKKIGTFMRVAGKWYISFTQNTSGFSFIGCTDTKEQAQQLAEAKLDNYLTAQKLCKLNH